MNYKIRVIHTGSNKQAVQIVNYVKRKRIILKHIGSGADVDTIELLKKKARQWIEREMDERGLWRKDGIAKFEEQYQYLGFTYKYA